MDQGGLRRGDQGTRVGALAYCFVGVEGGFCLLIALGVGPRRDEQ